MSVPRADVHKAHGELTALWAQVVSIRQFQTSTDLLLYIPFENLLPGSAAELVTVIWKSFTAFTCGADGGSYERKN